MKKSNIKKFTILGASIVLLSGSILLGGSLAKYITQVEGGGNADIAKWNFNVTSDGETLSTIKLTDSIHQNVRSEKIAPGTNGSFEIELDASSAEVSLDYKIEFLNEQNKPTNLKFSYEGTTTNNLKDLENLLKGEFLVDDTNKNKVLTINWEWPFETGTTEDEIKANDETDTTEGKTANSYTFDIQVTATQKNPNGNN